MIYTDKDIEELIEMRKKTKTELTEEESATVVKIKTLFATGKKCLYVESNWVNEEGEKLERIFKKEPLLLNLFAEDEDVLAKLESAKYGAVTYLRFKEV